MLRRFTDFQGLKTKKRCNIETLTNTIFVPQKTTKLYVYNHLIRPARYFLELTGVGNLGEEVYIDSLKFP